MENINIRKLLPSEYAAAMSLVLEIFLEFGLPDYNEEGVSVFKQFISNKRLFEATEQYMHDSRCYCY